MARRLLTAGLLLASLAWCGLTAAKPPDLPLVDKDVLAPQAPLGPAEAAAPSQPNPFPEAAEPAAPAAEAPLFFQVRPSARRIMASCLLFGVHPLLTLTPTRDYVDFDDEEELPISAIYRESTPNTEDGPHGTLTISVGVSSDSGLTGSIEMTGPAALECDEILRACWPLIPRLCDPPQSQAPGYINDFCPSHLIAGLSGPDTLTSDLDIPIQQPMAHQTGPGDSAESTCPWMRQQHWATHQDDVTARDLSHDVLHNLQSLSQAQTLLQTAREYGQSGHVDEALGCLELAHTLCPGSRVDEAVQEAAAYLFAPVFCGYSAGGHDNELGNESEVHRADKESANDLLKQCDYYYKEGNYETAAHFAELALEVDPDNTTAAAAMQGAQMALGMGFCLRDACAAHREDRHAHMLFRAAATALKTQRERKIQQKLAQQVPTLNFTEAPLRQVIDDLRAWRDLNIYVDSAALDAQEVSVDQPITIKVENISLKSALNLILKQAHLTYVIKDEVLQITTERGARGTLQRVTFPVADLVTPATGDAATSATQAKADALMKLITNTVNPEDWSLRGGEGTIDYQPLSMGIVVNQRADVQERVADFLNALRRLGGAGEEGEERQGVSPEDGCDALLRACHEAMDAGRQREAADLAARALVLDPEQAPSDPLVYKMHLADDDSAPVQITPCLPPVDPETPAALDQLYQESLRQPLAGSEEPEPPTAAPHGSFEFGFGLDGSLQMFGQLRHGGAIWHAFFGPAGAAVWSTPDGGADPAPAAEMTPEFDSDD